MIDFLNSFKSLVKVEKIHTDNNVFKLHYKITVIMLIVFSILLTSKQYFGEPIDCDVQSRKKLIDTFCWIYGTHTLNTSESRRILSGLGNDPLDGYDTRDRLEHTYYQWVCIIFCFQALTFYIPRYLWKSWEGGRLRHLVKDLTDPVLLPAAINPAKEKLLAYMTSGKYAHNVYAFRYCVCEILNLINVICQIYFLDWLLNNHFLDYGIDVVKGHANPMSRVFPKLSKCTYHRYGPSGSVEKHDALCILPLNILNEKLFLILWFWLFFLMFVTVLALLYRLVFLLFPTVRVYLLMGQTRNIGCKKARLIVKQLTFGDFFVLYNIGKNINFMAYRELVGALYDNMRGLKGRPAANKMLV